MNKVGKVAPEEAHASSPGGADDADPEAEKRRQRRRQQELIKKQLEAPYVAQTELVQKLYRNYRRLPGEKSPRPSTPVIEEEPEAPRGRSCFDWFRRNNPLRSVPELEHYNLDNSAEEAIKALRLSMRQVQVRLLLVVKIYLIFGY